MILRRLPRSRAGAVVSTEFFSGAMRLPIHALQPILIKALGQEEDAWYRSTVVDFQVHKELVVSLPTAKDRLGWEPPMVPDGGSVDDADDDMTDSQFARGTELEVQISFPDGLR